MLPLMFSFSCMNLIMSGATQTSFTVERIEKCSCLKREKQNLIIKVEFDLLFAFIYKFIGCP